jgi:hypothetical protein
VPLPPAAAAIAQAEESDRPKDALVKLVADTDQRYGA